MIEYGDILLAARARLDTLVVATTGSAALTATADGYTRSAGSFLTDGFRPGMEVQGVGFTVAANNEAKLVRNVTAGSLLCEGCQAEAELTAELKVTVPENVASENVPFERPSERPYLEEQFLPGGASEDITLGAQHDVEVLPSVVWKVYVPSGYAVKGLWGYAKKIIELFAPGTSLTVTDHGVWVRGDVGPFPSQVLQLDGFAVITVTVPLRVRTANPT